MQNTEGITSSYFERRDLVIGEDEIVVVSCMRNEGQRLPYFLDYYRRLGATRFLLVDNDSTDGTAEFLRAQPDVEYFATSSSYRGSSAGRLWMQELADTYATGRWVVTADVDELLVFPGSERLGLRDLCAYLDRRGHLGLFTVMLDMYSDRPMAETTYTRGTDFLDTCRFFEADTYEVTPGDNPPFLGIFGGPRGRLFAESNPGERGPMMKKVPLVKWVEGFSYIFSTHSHRFVQLSDITGALLHFKFFNTFEEVAAKDAVRGDRRQQAHYSAYQSTVGGGLCFFGEQSRRYDSPRDLVRLGMMCTTPAYADFLRDRFEEEGRDASVLEELLPEPEPYGDPRSLRSLHAVWPFVSNPRLARYFGRSETKPWDYRIPFVREMRRQVRVVDVAADHVLLQIGESALHRWERSSLGVAVHVGDRLVRNALVDGSDQALSVDTGSLESGICRLEVDIAGAAAKHDGPDLPTVTVYLFDGLDTERLEAPPESPEAAARLEDSMIHSRVWSPDGGVAGGTAGFVGMVELMRDGELRGWSYDTRQDRFDVPVVAYVNGRLARVIQPSRWRRDLARLRPNGDATGGRGFLERLPLGYFEDGGADLLDIEVVVAGTNLRLQRSPLPLPAGARYARWHDGDDGRPGRWETSESAFPPPPPPPPAAPRSAEDRLRSGARRVRQAARRYVESRSARGPA